MPGGRDDPAAKVEFQFLIYPRPDWTDGRERIVKQGADFNCSAESLVEQFQQHALECGWRRKFSSTRSGIRRRSSFGL